MINSIEVFNFRRFRSPGIHAQRDQLFVWISPQRSDVFCNFTKGQNKIDYIYSFIVSPMHRNDSPRIRLVYVIPLFLLSALHCGYTEAQYALQLQSPGTYIMHDDCPELHLSTFTAECWFQMNQDGIAVTADTCGLHIIPLIAKGYRENTTAAGINFLLGIQQEDSRLCAVIEEKVQAGNPRRYFSITGFTQLQENLWYQAAVSFDGTFATLYLNGIPEKKIELDMQPISSCSNGFSVGTTLEKNGSAKGFFCGSVDRIRVWNYARTNYEIRQTLNGDIETSQPGLIMSINFGEGQGQVLHAVGLLTSPLLVGTGYAWKEESKPSLLLPPGCNLPPILKIGLIADPQYCDCNQSGSRYYRESLRKLASAMDSCNAADVSFVVTLGDIVDSKPASFDSILPLFDKLKMPEFKVLGNHEFMLMPDSVKPSVLERYEMPGYYYDFSYNNWRFLVLDATDLATYTGILHPEEAEETDSMWQHIQGQINAYSWNGGIGRKQFEWIRKTLFSSYEKSEHVVIFCHNPVYPFNCWNNLWNDSAIFDLITGFPNVVAYINGHRHEGNYGFRNGVHFFTSHAMVETADLNSFSIMTVYPDRIEIDGQGLNPDMTWKYGLWDTLDYSIRITNSIIESKDTSGTYIGSVILYDGMHAHKEAAFQLDTDTLRGQIFRLSGDSLFLNTNEDLSEAGTLKACIKAMDCPGQIHQEILTFEFDSISIHLVHPLPDIVMDIGQKSYYLLVDSVFADSTRRGSQLNVQTGDTSIATVFLDDNILVCWPEKTGKTSVFLTARDIYTDFRVTDSFSLTIERQHNQAPVSRCIIDTLFFHTIQDTLKYLPDTLFSDPDGDSLIWTCWSADSSIAVAELKDNLLYIISTGFGPTRITLMADDRYGGTAFMVLQAVIKKPGPVIISDTPANISEIQYLPDRNEIVINTPFEADKVEISLSGLSGNITDILYRGILTTGQHHFSIAHIHPPGVYLLLIRKGNVILGSHKIAITSLKN
jgi:manganese-dependent ADP-ribose/CDP-alcohol diphosphatase